MNKADSRSYALGSLMSGPSGLGISQRRYFQVRSNSPGRSLHSAPLFAGNQPRPKLCASFATAGGWPDSSLRCS